MAAIGLSGVVGLLFEVAELQGALVFRRTEFDTAFAGRVVEDELVVAALPALAGIELLAFEAGQTGVVGVGLAWTRVAPRAPFIAPATRTDGTGTCPTS